MLGGSRRAKTSLDNLRAQMKIMVDGPSDDDFVLCKRLPGGGAAYVASRMCREAQNHYFHEFGGKDFTVSDAKANAAGLHTPAPRTHKGIPQKSVAGSKQHAVQQQLAELKRALAGEAGAVASATVSEDDVKQFQRLALETQKERQSAQQLEEQLEKHDKRAETEGKGGRSGACGAGARAKKETQQVTKRSCTCQIR